jgi:L-alanine-DL-glutamate epimerase-like enolase superfamily enzyme
LDVPTAPGFGLEFNQDTLNKYTVNM